MTIRDLVPWSRQENRVSAMFGQEEQRSPLVQFRREMDRLFDNFFQAPLFGDDWGLGLTWPRIEVKETEDEVRITAELPGLGEKDVELFVEDGMLILRGEKKSENQDRDRGWSELHYGRFERRIALPDGAEHENCRADFRDGVLTVRMPRSAQAERGRRIPINADTRH